MSVDPGALTYDAAGLLPVVVQDVASGAVLMLAYANREAVERTVATGRGWFWSRSRGELWQKGETSGNLLRVHDVRTDCDGDALLYRVDPAGPACHTGARSCFEQPVEDGGGGHSGPRLELGWLWQVLESRVAADPEGSYTARLLAAGVERAARKVGEEATETVIAALRSKDAAAGGSELAAEAGDLIYHLLVLLLAADGGVTPDHVAAELRRRHARSTTPPTPKPEEA